MNYPATLAYKNGSINDSMWRMMGQDGRIEVHEDVRLFVVEGELYVRVSDDEHEVIAKVCDRVSWTLVTAIDILRRLD